MIAPRLTHQGNTMQAARLLLAASLALAAAPALAQGGPDELWEMTTRMEMAGMPGQTFNSKSCMKKGQTQPDKMNQDKNCKVLEQRTVGNTVHWKMECTGRDPMTGEGEVTRTKDKMDGKIRMQGKRGKDAFDMTTVMSGRLVGTCNAEDQNKQMQAAAAAGSAQLAQACTEAMNKYSPYLYDGDNAACKAQKAQYCANVTKASQTMRTPAGYRSMAKKADWNHNGKVCNVNFAAPQAEACKSANGSRDWPFVADFCPAESKAIAAQHCAGRGYTAAMASEYKEVCQKYAGRRSGGDEPRPAAAQQQQQPAAPAAPSAADTIKEGANQLRKLFGR
jgi:hypothetical protein